MKAVVQGQAREALSHFGKGHAEGEVVITLGNG